MTMYDYIVGQPDSLKEAYAQKENYAFVLRDLLRKHNVRSIVCTGSGTSGHVACMAAKLIQKHLNIPAYALLPMEFVNTPVMDGTLVIGMSESGNSLSTLHALEWAKKNGGVTLAFTTDEDSELAELCEYVMPHPCSMELVPPETKGYTTALLAWIVAVYTAAGIERDMEPAIDVLKETVEKSEQWVRDNLHDLIRFDRMRVIGSGLHYVSAMEGALKMQETIRRPLPSIEMEEFSHVADLALEDTDCVFMIIRSERDREVLHLVEQITDRIHVFDSSFFPIDLNDDLSILHVVVPFQMAGAIVAERIGNDTSKYPYEIENISHSEQYIFR